MRKSLLVAVLLVLELALVGLSVTGPEFVNLIRSKNEPPFSSIGLYNSQGPDALKLAQKNGKVIVAVIDTGISPQVRQILEELNMFTPGINIDDGSTDLSDTNGHGTRMVSLIPTVSPNVKVLFLKNTGPNLSAVVNGIEYARRIAEQEQAKLVVNMSFGAPRADWIKYLGVSEAGIDNVLSQFAADFAELTKDAVVVACAGNNGNDDVWFPARFPGVISVGATVSNTSIADYSNYGPLVKVYAPGDLKALNSDGKWWTIWGTSGASILVSSLAGLIWAYNPNLSPNEVRDIIFNTATPIGSGEKTGKLINALGAIQFTQTLASQQAKLTITKTVVGQAPTANWSFTGTGSIGTFTLPGRGGSTNFTLTTGSYTITEKATPGYTASVSCSNGALGTDHVTVTLSASQTVTCTFTNTKESSD